MVQQTQPVQKNAMPAKPVASKPVKAQPPAQPAQAQQPTKKKSKWWLWLIVVIGCLGLGILIGAIL